MAKPCDSCNTAPAAIFCGAHSAFLCPICDADLHAPPTRHPRIGLCDVCEQSPSAVTCKADAVVLCSACDADIHAANPLSRRHHRLPVLPFYHAAAAEDFSDEEAEAASWILPDPNNKPDLNFGSPRGANPGRAERKQVSTDGVVPGEDNREYESGQYPGRITDGFPAFDLEYSGSKPFMYNFTTSQSINQSISYYCYNLFYEDTKYSHIVTTKLQRHVVGHSNTLEIRPLNEEMAVQSATYLLGELLVFSVAEGAILYEVQRSTRCEANRKQVIETMKQKNEELAAEVKLLEQRVLKLDLSVTQTTASRFWKWIGYQNPSFKFQPT